MRKFLLTITVLGAFVALGGAAFAVAASTQSADVYGVGAGRTDTGMFKFDLSAHTTGVRDFGHVGVTERVGPNQVSYYLDVDCVSVSGTTATIGGTVQKVTPFRIRSATPSMIASSSSRVTAAIPRRRYRSTRSMP